MTEILLVRHGQAAFGTDDYDRLTEIGWRQSHLLGTYLSERESRFDAVFSGTLRRHRETLAGMSEALPPLPPVRELPGLNEFDFHALVSAYRQRHPDDSVDVGNAREFYRCLRDALLGWHRGELDGLDENWAQFEARVRATLAEMAQLSGRVLVISSGGPISALVREVLELSVEHMVSLNLQAINTGVTRLVGRPGQPRLNMFNAVPHLEPIQHRHLQTYT